MIIFVNGAFGIGKTTVARELVSRLPRARLYDPELAGIAMQRLARLFGRRVDDFQNLKLWRRFTIIALRITHWFSPNVIVPMAFSNVDYLHEIRDAVARFEPRTLHFCLVAPLDIVRQRLATRDVRPADAAWQQRRAAECCAAHAQPEFAVHIDATRNAHEVAEQILQQMT